MTLQIKTTFKKPSLIRIKAGGKEYLVLNLKFKFSVVTYYYLFIFAYITSMNKKNELAAGGGNFFSLHNLIRRSGVECLMLVIAKDIKATCISCFTRFFRCSCYL